MLTRLSPYVMGLYVSQLYFEELEAPNRLLEWVAFLGMLFIGIVSGVKDWLNAEYISSYINIVW